MGLCRSVPGSHPARSPGAVEGLHGGRACPSLPRVGACIVFRPDSAKRFPEGCGQQRRSGHGTSGGGRTRGVPFHMPSAWALKLASPSGSWGVTGSGPAWRTVWTNPALWSATNQENFCCCGQGPVDGAGVLGAGRPVRENSRKAAARGRWTGSEVGEGRGSGEGSGLGEGRCRAVKAGKDGIAICGQAGAPHRTAPQKVPVSSDPGRGAPCRKRGRLAVCAAPKLHRVSACPGPTGHFMLFLRYGAEPCRRLQKIFPQYSALGRGRGDRGEGAPLSR